MKEECSEKKRVLIDIRLVFIEQSHPCYCTGYCH